MGRKRGLGVFAKGNTEAARVGGSALQAKLREQKRLAALAGDYEAALRTVLEMIAATGDAPVDELLKIGAYVHQVLKKRGAP